MKHVESYTKCYVIAFLDFVLVLAGIGRAIVMEQGLGVTAGHAEAMRIVEGWLARLAPLSDG